MQSNILIPTDFGYAFDYLAILELKNLKGLSSDSIVNEVKDVLAVQLSDFMFDLVYSSQEYAECLRVNTQVFEAVDKAKKDEVPASIVHALNHQRYLAKTALQKKFFSDSELTEKKN